MGLVTVKLVAILREQIQKHGTIVWYDPEGHYQAVAAQLTGDQLGGAPCFCYQPEEGFFSLRHALEAHWGSLDLNAPPRLLIYVPLAQSRTHHALIEYEVGGAVLQPGQQPPEQDTALSAVARKALELLVPPARLEEIIHDVAAGRLSLAELDELAERGAQIGPLMDLFGTANVTDAVLVFLSNPDVDARIVEKHAHAKIAKALTETLAVDFSTIRETADLRTRAAHQILLTDYAEALGDALPGSSAAITLAGHPAARQAAVDLARQWRNRRDLAPSYVKWAAQVEAELPDGWLSVPLEALAQAETFLGAETRLQSLVEEALLKRPAASLIELATQRSGGFWASQRPEIKMRWQVILNAGHVLQEAARIESGLKGKQWNASKLFAQYVYGETPWCALDTAHRHLERDIYRYDIDLQAHDTLQKLIAQASQRYASTVNRLAELFVHAYKDEHFELREVQLQTDIFRDHVAPLLSQKERVAYILVDAFRFEMARELDTLIRSGESGWKSELIPALATPPTITDVGMAALMPGAEEGVTLKLEQGKIVPYIAGKAVRTANARFDRLATVLSESPLIITLDDIAPLLKPTLTKALEKAQMVVVTASDDIDGLGEAMPKKARRSMDEVLSLLRRGLAALFKCGFHAAIITADHGFILADRLEESDKIDAPFGQPSLLKRRVWVGHGGSDHPATMRAPLSAFGIGGDLQLVTPYGLAAFKVQGGNNEYFHGGLALQEIVIPVLKVEPVVVPAPTVPGKLTWTLTLGSPKITSPYVSVTIEATSSQLLPIEPPTVRVEIRDQQQTLSVPVSASYGFQDATKDVKLAVGESAQSIEKDTVMLLVTEKPSSRQVDIHLLDANTGLSLAMLPNVEIDLSLFD